MVKQPKKIKIALVSGSWIDLTNNQSIGGIQELIDYVNLNWYVVDNDDCFLYTRDFWYNKEGK